MFKKYNNSGLLVFVFCSFFSVLIFLNKDSHFINQSKLNISNVFHLVFKPKIIIEDLKIIKNENDSLINHLKKISVENKILKQRIRDAKDYYKFIQKTNDSYNLIAARVLNHSMSMSSKILNLDKGFLKGIPKKSKAVIDFDGNLVGRTFFIDENKSQVHKINDRNFHVFVKTNRDIKGQFTYKSGNRGVLESVAKKYHNDIIIGDTIFTTSASNIYAENIPVAKIINIENIPAKHELDITVEILANLNTVRNVFVVSK